jgi:hypothetical protein
MDETQVDKNEFYQFFETNKEHVFTEIEDLTKTSETKISVQVFSMCPKLLDLIENNLKNPSDKPPLICEFKDYLKNEIIFLNIDEKTTHHSPLFFSTTKGKESFIFTAPELLNVSFYQLIIVYVWCKYLIESGYSGVIPELTFE